VRLNAAVRAHNAGRESALAEAPSVPPDAAAWPDDIHAIFRRNGVAQVGYVPDTGHARLIALCQQDNAIIDVVLTSEAEGPGLVLGAALGGRRAALLMQSSGVGNCINTFSLLRNCGVACVILVTMRGEFDDFNPWQVPMGSITEQTLKLAGFLTYRVEREEEVEEIVAAGCNMAFGGNLQVAILLAQRMVDRSTGHH
jgi:sulfopyruvate decarboxylase TPP-binding subunit